MKKFRFFACILAVFLYVSAFDTYALSAVDYDVKYDVDADGAINTKDITRLMRNIAGTDVSISYPDVNSDGLVNAKDITRLMKYIAGDHKDNNSVISLYWNEVVTFSGTLKKEYYEISSLSKGTQYILDLESPVTCKFYDDFFGFDGFEKTIDSVQVSINDVEYDIYAGKSVTVTGAVVFAHTGHHLRDVVLINCEID